MNRMKTLLVGVLGFSVLVGGAAQASEGPALEAKVPGFRIEVAPLVLKTEVEVLGVVATVDGTKAIILTGKVAKAVAQAAGQVFDETKEMLVVTGRRAAELAEQAAVAVGKTAKTVYITTRDFAVKVGSEIFEAIKAGTCQFIRAVNTLGKETANVIKTVGRTTWNVVVVVGDTGVRVLKGGFELVGNAAKFIRDILGSLGFGIRVSW